MTARTGPAVGNLNARVTESAWDGGARVAAELTPPLVALHPLTPIVWLVVAARRVVARPSLLLIAVFALLLVPAARSEDGSGTTITLPDLALVTFAVLVLLKALREPEALKRLRSPVVLVLAGVLLAAALATLTAQDTSSGLVGLLRSTQVFVVGPLAVLLCLRSARDTRLVLWLYVGLGTLQGIVGVFQYLTRTGASFGGEPVRAVGTFGAYDVMAMAATVRYAIIICVAVALTAGGRRARGAAALSVFLVLPLVLSLSRGALLSAIVAVFVVVLVNGWRRAVALVVIGAAVAGLSVVVLGDRSPVAERLASIATTSTAPDQSVQDRYALWAAARSMFVEHPVTGVGPKNFPHQRDAYSPLDLSTGSDVEDGAGYRRVPLLSPHSFYYLVLAEQGLVGVLAHGALFGLLLVGALVRLHRTPRHDRLHRALGLTAVGLLVSFLVDSIYSDPGGSTTVLLSLMLGVAAWWVSGARAPQEPT